MNYQIEKIMTAATVSKEFRQKLLTNPKEALNGNHKYLGETLEVNPDNRAILLSANTKTLEELAKYLAAALN